MAYGLSGADVPTYAPGCRCYEDRDEGARIILCPPCQAIYDKAMAPRRAAYLAACLAASTGGR